MQRAELAAELADRDALVLHHLYLLPSVAREAHVAFLRGPVADSDDFWAAGATGIVQAAKRYDPTRGPFAPLAFVAARFEMRTEVRQIRWRKQAAARPDRRRIPLLAAAAPTERYSDSSSDESGYSTLCDLLADPHDDPPDVQVELAERAAAVRAAVARLAPHHREVVEAYYFRGEEQPAIAARLGIGQPAVSLRLSVARRHLARCLHRYAPATTEPTEPP